jgi:protein disulfide-isomerase-like protein
MANNTNRNNKNNNKSKTNSNGGNKDTLLWLGFLIIVVVIIFALYYIQKQNNKSQYENFENDNINIKPTSGECVVVLFYAEWCGHCKEFKPKFEAAMQELNGKQNKNGKVLRLVKVDCDIHKALSKEYNITGYPTVKILNDDNSVNEYDGERSLEGLKLSLLSDD